MEGNVYVCTWKKSKKQYVFALKNYPKIAASDESFSCAEEKIWELICLELGDGEAVLEFEPSPPVESFLKGYDSPAIVSVSGNDTVDTWRLTPGLFEKDYCPVCTRAWGERTNTDLEVESLPSKSDGACCMSIPALGRIFSENFLSLLTKSERSRLRFQSVKAKKPSKRQFFELVANPIVKFVGLSGLPGFNRSPCGNCGYQPQSHLFENKIYQFVVFEDLPKPIPTVFALGHRGSDLCMTAKRWQELRGKPGTKNLVASSIFVIPRTKAQKVSA
jgi:hypothetical protein